MIRAAIGFFVLGIIGILLGAYHVAGISIELGEILFVAFLIVAFLCFLASIFSGRPPSDLP